MSGQGLPPDALPSPDLGIIVKNFPKSLHRVILSCLGMCTSTAIDRETDYGMVHLTVP